MNDDRFVHWTVEELDIKDVCEKCGRAVQKGKPVRMMALIYCPNCNTYRPMGPQYGNSTSKKDTKI